MASAGDDISGPAKRGQVVQRIIVDGWTTDEAARAVGLEERVVARWVADYRRRGMASLRENAAGPQPWQRLALFFRSLRRGLGHWLGATPTAPPASAMPLRLGRDDHA